MYNHNFLAEKLAEAGSMRLRKEVFICESSASNTTYVQFFHNAEKSAQFLVHMGVRPNDTVLVYAPKSMASIELYFGCLLAGVIYTPINPDTPAGEVPYFIEDAKPALIVCDKTRYQACFGDQHRQTPVLTINEDGSGSFVDQRNAQSVGFAAVPRTKTDAAAILYTSGTTGRPKGVVHTHGSLWSNAEVLVQAWSFRESDVLIHALPIFHLHGLFTAVNVMLAAGASCFFLPKFDRDAVLALMAQSTVMMGVPPFYMSLLDHPQLTEATREMRLFISGSAPMLPQTHEAWQKATGKMILERYGMTECSMIASNPYDGRRKPNSVGFPLEGIEVRITDTQTKAPLPQGEIGMIEIRGPNLFDGYFNKPDKTAEDMREDGFFISGDFGRYDEEGYLFVLGRVKDAIFTEAGVVMPKEIEELIDAQPGVAESAVISAPHPRRGSVPIALLVGTDLDIPAIDEALRKVLPDYKVPVNYLEQAALPRNAMGKVQKSELRAANADLFSDESVV